MREPITEGQVDKAYDVVVDCFERAVEHFEFCAGLQGKYPIGKGDQAIPLASEDLKTIVNGLKSLGARAEEANRMLASVERDLHAIHDAPISTRSIVAASWAEAAMELAKGYLKLREGWEGFKELDGSGQQALFRACFRNLPDAPHIRASLKIEKAKLGDRALAMSSDVRFGYVLRKLTPKPRLLMERLIQREGRLVDYEEVGEAVWGDREVTNGNIQQVMRRLRSELESLGSGEIAREIKSENGAYRFR